MNTNEFLQELQFLDKYSRFDYELGRRRTWEETVRNAVDYLIKLSDGLLEDEDYQQIYNEILEKGAMPSMRLLASAGPAADRQNIAIYNCSYLPVESTKSFVEAMIIALAGSGVGYSVESRYTSLMPKIKKQKKKTKKNIFVIPDSAEGWASALEIGLKNWFNGNDVEFDYSEIRPAGSILKTKGGRAPGPEPLEAMLDWIREKILSRQNKYLSTLDCHDIMCRIGQTVISGGIRRTAMISLFDFDDEEMLHCKDGNFWEENPQRWRANNSAVWERELTHEEIRKYLDVMHKSNNGEPGIFSRLAAKRTSSLRREKGEFGTNPCGEIVQVPFQFCNLSSIVCRETDTKEDILRKVKIATIIGTIQSMAQHFPGLRPEWKENAIKERILGVDPNGQMDSALARDPWLQREMRKLAIDTNRDYAAKLGINQSVAVTCVKPSGNSSVLLDCAPGLNPRWSPYYIRNIRLSAHNPLSKLLMSKNVPMDPENGQTWENADTYVVHIPIKSPDGAITRKDFTAIEKLNYWKQVKVNYTEHNPSVTITYNPDELDDIVDWVYENQLIIGGLSFLPNDNSTYEQMPYEEITEKEYNKLVSEFPEVDLEELFELEKVDNTNAAQELACVAGHCEI